MPDRIDQAGRTDPAAARTARAADHNPAGRRTRAAARTGPAAAPADRADRTGRAGRTDPVAGGPAGRNPAVASECSRTIPSTEDTLRSELQATGPTAQTRRRIP